MCYVITTKGVKIVDPYESIIEYQKAFCLLFLCEEHDPHDDTAADAENREKEQQNTGGTGTEGRKFDTSTEMWVCLLELSEEERKVIDKFHQILLRGGGK